MNKKHSFENFFDLDLVLLLISDMDGRITKVNKAWETTLGYTEEELLGRIFLEFIHPDDQAPTLEQIKLLNQQKDVPRFVNRYRGKDGAYKYLEWNAKPDQESFYSVAREVTEIVKANEELKKQQERYTLAVEGSLVGIWDLDLTTDQIYFSPIWKAILGYRDDELENDNAIFIDRLHPEDGDRIVKEMEDFVQSGDTIWDQEFRLRHRDGSYRWIRSRGKFYWDEQGRAYRMAGAHSDITDRKEAEEQILYLSYHDNLTGLYNRHYYKNLIETPVPSNYLPLTLIVADVNGLKLANDAFGHAFGDQLLVRFAEVLKKNPGPSGLAARIGGDEFVLLLPNTAEEEAIAVIQRIEAACSEETIQSVGLSASLGYSIITDRSLLPQDAYKLAEDAMYRQKMVEGGNYRNSVVKRIIEDVFQRNPDDRDHSDAVERICLTLGTALAMNETELMDLSLAARLHDIGKIGVDDSLTGLDETLEDLPSDEFKKHPPIGYYILHSASEYSHIAEYVLAHHERMDGKGYPKGLIGEQIPIQARIIRLASDLDLMQRKNRWSREEIIAYLEENSGIVYDPDLVKIACAWI